MRIWRVEGDKNYFGIHRGEDNVPDEDEHLSQVIGSDTDHGDEQDLGTEGRGGEPHLNEDDQNMCANTEDYSDIIELGGEQCSDTRGNLILGKEEKRLLDRPNIETSVMDTETDTQGPKDDKLNLQIGLVGDEEVTERDLVKMDSEETRGNGTEDETILPGDLGELGGKQCSDTTRADPTQGGEEKRKLGRPDTETNDRDPETDNTQILNNDELNIQIDLVEDEEVTERDPTNMDSKVTRGNGAEDTTILYEGRIHNDTSVETIGEPTESDQLSHNVGVNECVTRIALDSGDDTVMIEHLAEGSEERCHDRATVTVNVQQHTKDPSETIARLIQSVREQESDELETSPGKRILEKDKKIATGGDQVDIDPETTGDGRPKIISVKRRRRRSNNEGQGFQPPAPPTKIAEDIKERNHVSKTMVLLSSRRTINVPILCQRLARTLPERTLKDYRHV